MAETPLPELQPASQNEWYKLATVAGGNHAENKRRWNGYMRHLIGEEEAANLKRAAGTPICLPTLRSDEIEWITSNIPDLPYERPSMISLAELTFAEAVNFQDFYFPVSVAFWASTFEEYADFGASTFVGPAYFTGSSFAGAAYFGGSTFAGAAYFGGSSFAGAAYFRASTFEKSTFEETASFAGSTFGGPASFEKSTFADDADFSNATYEGKTSFQNVIFTVAPLFFETTLHEDTDWTGITWPAKPANKEDATQYVRRYERLALMMSTLQQPDNKHRFFRLSMQAKEVHDGWGISTGLSRLYGLFFRYGWGLERALGLWVLHILLGAGCLSVMALWQRSQPLPDLAKIVQALAVSFSNSHPFLGLQRGPVESAHNSFHTLTGFDILWTIQSLSGPILLFFLLLTIRNRFRLR